MNSIQNKTGFLYGPLQAMYRILVALLIALLPKCGLCLAAYMNLFSILGISMTRIFPWILPILSLLLLVNVVIGWKKARQLKDYRAFCLSLTGMLLVLAARVWLLPSWYSYTGMGLLLTGSVIQLWQSSKMCNRSLQRYLTGNNRNTI